MQNIQRLDDLLIQAVDETLTSLGKSVKNQIYILLEENYSIQKQDLPQKTARFSEFLYRVFGAHARLIELKCMKSFYSKIKKDPNLNILTVSLEDNNLTFSAYTEAFRETIKMVQNTRASN